MATVSIKPGSLVRSNHGGSFDKYKCVESKIDSDDEHGWEVLTSCYDVKKNELFIVSKIDPRGSLSPRLSTMGVLVIWIFLKRIVEQGSTYVVKVAVDTDSFRLQNNELFIDEDYLTYSNIGVV